MADLADLLFEGSLAGPTGFVVVGHVVKFESVTGPAHRDLPFAADLVKQLALTARLHSFRRITSAASLSSGRSATSFFSLPFSSSVCFSRRLSAGSRPPYYFFFQLK